MRKNIKKIIAVAIITVSIFTLMGCGQTKEELKEEIKQEIKADETGIKTEELENVTKESLREFQLSFDEYKEKMNNSLGFMFTDDNPNKITVEQGQIIMKEAENMESDIITKAPSVIKDDVSNYFDFYKQLATNTFKTLKFGDEENSIITKRNSTELIIINKIKEIKTQLDSK